MPAGSDAANFDETVRRFIQRYGDNAKTEADRRVRELEKAGDPDGAATWRRMAAAIASRASGPGSDRLH